MRRSVGAAGLGLLMGAVAAGRGTTLHGEAVRIDVRVEGTIGCATFPYSCRAMVSVLEPDATVTDAWRPPGSDATWFPDASQGMAADRFNPTPSGSMPSTTPGRHRLVVSLLGTSNVPSFNPDGSPSTELLDRCTTDLEVRPGSEPLDVVVTFGSGDGCSIAVRPT